MTDLAHAMTRAVALRADSRDTEALAILLDLERNHPLDAPLQYELACTYDQQGLETEAIPHYENALELGLTGEERRGALLGLGSSYRSVGELGDALRVLQKGANEFPDAREFEVFLALARHNAGDHAEAMRLLLRHIADFTSDPSTARYRRAIGYYADHLYAIDD